MTVAIDVDAAFDTLIADAARALCPVAQHVSDQEGGVAIGGGVRVIDVVDCAAGRCTR
jgi:hypothetical protein